MTKRFFVSTARPGVGWPVMDAGAPGQPALICNAPAQHLAELVARGLNRLPEIEEEFRNARLANRRKENNSPDSETN